MRLTSPTLPVTTISPPNTIGLAVVIALTLTSCGAQSNPSRPSSSISIDAAEDRALQTIDGLRESALALEYLSNDTPPIRRRASGVVINEEGDVLSIRIDPPGTGAPVMARDASGRRTPARWIAADNETGLTLLKIAPGLARPATVARNRPRLGGPILLIGNPFGLDHSVSRGYVSGLNRRVELGSRQLGGLIQVDVALHPGDSGALLADQSGGWLGLIRGDLGFEKDKDKRTQEHDHDLGFAIPASDALWVADQLRTHKRVDRAYLGVTMHEFVPADDRESDGVILAGVLSDTPADRSGLKAGDRLVSLDDHPVRTPTDLTDRLDRLATDLDVKVDVLRGTGPSPERLRLTVHTSARPVFESSPKPATPPPAPARPKPKSEVPREVAERIERLEHRIEELEKREAATISQTPQP